MFNHYHTHSPRITVEKNNTTHEHRAPTDDSIRLYHDLCRKEMKRRLKKHTLCVRDGKLYQAPLNGKLLDPSGYTVLNTLPEEEALDLYINHGETT